jgi:hypothetical protein
MRPTVVLRFGTCIIGLLAAFVQSYGRPGISDYSRETVAQLIDDLTQIESESPGISTSAIYVGFLAEDTSASGWVGTRGVAPPEVPPQMRELVRRGPLALPEPIKHLDDKRPTKLEIGNLPPGFAFSGKVFGYEYDPRMRDWEPEDTRRGFRWTAMWFKDRYTVKVGDVCFALIGQIVNRHLSAVRLQPTGFLVVNSPIEVPDLLDMVKSDWGSGDAEIVKASLLADIHSTSHPPRIDDALCTKTVVNPALRRLRLYFPDAYMALAGGDQQRKREFESQDSAHSSPSIR